MPTVSGPKKREEWSEVEQIVETNGQVKNVKCKYCDTKISSKVERIYVIIIIYVILVESVNFCYKYNTINLIINWDIN